MNTIRFNSVMTKFQPNIKKEDVYVMFQLKVNEDSTIRGLPQQFKKQIDLSNIFSASASNDNWDKVNIPLSDYRMKYTVDFAGMQFEAKLENIAAVIKTDKTGVPNTEYTLTFYKELDKDMDTQLAMFLKRKEVDPESGKKKVVEYNTVLTEL